MNRRAEPYGGLEMLIIWLVGAGAVLACAVAVAIVFGLL